MSGNLGETRGKNSGKLRETRGIWGEIRGNLGESRGISGNLWEARGNSGEIRGKLGETWGKFGGNLTMEKRKAQKTNEKMKVANLQKQWLEPLDLFGKTDLPAETQTKKMTHIVGMQPANQGDYSKCLWGDIDCASAPWPN